MHVTYRILKHYHAFRFFQPLFLNGMLCLFNRLRHIKRHYQIKTNVHYNFGSVYCKFRNFRENFIFANSIKGYICQVKILQLRHDLPISVNDRMILPFHEGFIFVKLCIMRSFTKIKHSQKFPNLQYIFSLSLSVSVLL